ncbi:MAG TPA: tetratricopeptide repeat protein [Pyrinomonadaceae bacterium]|nr:tetratricopeptide repeat protein [Pyrinomonadaceae bacterium]
MRNKFGAAALAAALVFAPFTNTAAALAATARTTAAQDDAPSQAEQDIFNKGRDLFAQGRYDQAAGVFRDFLKSYPNSFIADLMLLWLGRSYIELGNLQEAEQVSQRLRAFKDTPFVDIYESELQNARRDSQAATKRPTPGVTTQPSATETAAVQQPVARPTTTPTPQPRLIGQTPTTTPRRNSRRGTGTPSLVLRGEGSEQRPRSVSQPPTRANSATARVRPTPTPTPIQPRRETPAQVASNNTRLPVPTPTPARPRETPEPYVASVTPPPVTSDPVPATGAQGGFSITVRQVPDLQLALRRAALAASPGQVIQLPLVITNTGNKEDQFRLETDLPAEYQPTFSSAQSGDTTMPIYVTPQLTRGSNMEVMLNIRVPDNVPDNQQQRFLVRAASQADSTVLRVADASLTVVAAALAASSNVGQETVMPGDTFTQRISVRNQGSATAKQARADFVFNPDFELVSANPSPISYDRPSRTAIWSLGDLESRDNREITVTMRAVPDALATTNRSLGRGTMRTQSLIIPSNFDGPAISVGRVARAQVESVSTGLTATPGDTIYIPFFVRNPGNYPESYELRITAPGAPAATIFADTNGDGQHQENEPAVTQTAALDPRGGQYPVLLRVDIPRNTPDRQLFAYNLVTHAQNSPSRVASEASTVLTVAAPRVRVRAELGNVDVKPGDTIFYRLVLVIDGGGLAKNLTVTESLPGALEFISSSPALDVRDAAGGARQFAWRVPELAPGDTAVLQVTVRVRPNLAADDVISPRHSLTYQDTNGNTHQGQ